MGNASESFSLFLLIRQTKWLFILLAGMLMVGSYIVFKQYPRIWSITIGYEPAGLQWITADIARICRLVFNEISVILLVRGVFREQQYVRFTVLVMFIELVVLMPIYFILRDVYPIINTGMIHHFLFNPFIGALLIIALLHQKYSPTA